jgi:glycosyltransferase involved in cell wall biosynthesis
VKVAVVVPGGVDRSGVQRVIPVLLWFIRRIARVHDVHVFSMRGSDVPDRYPLEGATVHQVGATGRATLPTLRAITAEHRRGAFDLVHAFWASGPGVPAALAARRLRRPLLLHVTGGDMASVPSIRYGGCRTRIGRARVRFALRSATAITAPSRIVCDAVERFGHRPEHLFLGVDREAWAPAEPRERDPAAPAVLLQVASLNPVKDQATLLRTARRLAADGVEFTLDVVGEDTLHGSVQRLAKEYELGGRVRFPGFRSQAELRPIVAGADLLVVTSVHEADPIAMLEAAMVGVPTVGTSVGHIRDWAPGAAVAVPPGDDRALAREIVALLEDEGRRRAIAAEAATRARAADADTSAARMLELYRSVVDNGVE